MLDKIENCMCGAVQGFWYEPGMTMPFQGKGQNGRHSPLGCFRQGGDPFQVAKLFVQLTGTRSEGIDYWVQYQVVMARLADRIDVVSTLPVVLTPTPCHPVRAYEITPPAAPRARGGTPGTPRVQTSPARVPGWDETTGRVKPPWEK